MRGKHLVSQNIVLKLLKLIAVAVLMVQEQEIS